VLSYSEVSIPGCAVENYDNTLPPGYFKIRVGDTVFEVMEVRIAVGGEDFQWKPL
jgi:hypothetical protein